MNIPHKIYLADGQIMQYQIPEKSKYESFFLFSIHKSGSTLANKILQDICDDSGIPVINLPSFLFGVPRPYWEASQSINELLMEGYCYNGFRFLPKIFINNPFILSKKRIFVFRDPRDALVSYYYTEIYNHPLPPKGTRNRENMIKRRELLKEKDINEYVKEKAPFLIDSYKRYLFDKQLVSGGSVFRYEDIIFNKANFVKQICDYIGINHNIDYKRIASKHDIIPTSEDQTKFIRKAIPGDHKEKLNKKTISWLNQYLSEILERFDSVLSGKDFA
jgi:hypothetical protein